MSWLKAAREKKLLFINNIIKETEKSEWLYVIQA
jgi:hypothetical protein